MKRCFCAHAMHMTSLWKPPLKNEVGWEVKEVPRETVVRTRRRGGDELEWVWRCIDQERTRAGKGTKVSHALLVDSNDNADNAGLIVDGLPLSKRQAKSAAQSINSQSPRATRMTPPTTTPLSTHSSSGSARQYTCMSMEVKCVKEDVWNEKQTKGREQMYIHVHHVHVLDTLYVGMTRTRLSRNTF